MGDHHTYQGMFEEVTGNPPFDQELMKATFESSKMTRKKDDWEKKRVQ